MFKWFGRKPSEGEMMCAEWNRENDRLEALYESAQHIEGCTPSVEGNKVIFDAPELESKITKAGDGITLIMHTGSVELDMPNCQKIFKNDQGQTTRIEVFQSMRPRMQCA